MVLKHVPSPHPTKDDAGFRAAVEQAKLSLSEGGYGISEPQHVKWSTIV